MAWTYNSLLAAVTKFLDPTGDDFFDGTFPTCIKQAEERILHATKVPPFRKQLTVANVNTELVTTLTDLMGPIAVYKAGAPLLFKEQSWIREVYGLNSSGTPLAYALRQDEADQQKTQVIVAPYPAAPTNFQLEYFAKPQSLADTADKENDTTWISTNAENALFYGTLYHAYVYEKGEADVLKSYQDEFEKALSLLKGMAVGNMRRDENKTSPQPEA